MEQIFAWRVEGIGFRTIATRLTEQGFPCPSAADRERNPHRHGRAWSVGAVRTIVMNPKYKGQGSYGRYRKVERLFDVNDPAAGNVTRMSPAPASEVIETDGIVPRHRQRDGLAPGADRPGPGHPGPRPDRSQPSPYALRGLIVCAPVRQADAGPHGQAQERRHGGSATSASTGPSTPATTPTPDHSSWLRTGFCPRSMPGWRI